jgi:hypothetical protein
MMNDILCDLIEVMINDYESYTERDAESIHATPEVMNYIFAKTSSGSITIDKDGVYRIAGIRIVADINMNRGGIEIQ